jgi:uncharacterized protein YndB with AHSA1/START domain
MSSADMASLVARRTIRATAQRLFDAWTQPSHLKYWWGPPGVDCIDAQVDLRPGGVYRIANRFPDGSVVWITGQFQVIEPPSRLVYTWRLETQDSAPERVTVRFEERGELTEVIVLHERISDDAARRGHQRGWDGCLIGLEQYVRGAAASGASEPSA